MAVWKKVLHENSPVADFPSLTAAKISDFDTEVTNNVTVAANGVFATTVHYLEAVNLKVNLASTSLSTAVLHGNDNDITDIGVSGTLPVANGGTGVTSKTGTGANVQATSPTLVTPVLGTPASGNLANCSGLPAHSGALITSGTVASARLDSDTAHLSGTQTFSGAKTFSSGTTSFIPSSGGARIEFEESGGSEGYLYSGGSFSVFRTQSAHPIGMSANYSSGDDDNIYRVGKRGYIVRDLIDKALYAGGTAQAALATECSVGQ